MHPPRMPEPGGVVQQTYRQLGAYLVGLSTRAGARSALNYARGHDPR